MSTRVFRSMRDMVLKGTAKGTISVNSPLDPSERFSNSLSNSDNQRRVYIPPPAVPKPRLSPTGERVYYTGPSDILGDSKLTPHALPVHVPDIKVTQPIGADDIRRVYLKGGSHPKINRTQWLRDNSIDNILLPTAANYLCPKCGLTRSCKCESFDSHGRAIA